MSDAERTATLKQYGDYVLNLDTAPIIPGPDITAYEGLVLNPTARQYA